MLDKMANHLGFLAASVKQSRANQYKKVALTPSWTTKYSLEKRDVLDKEEVGVGLKMNKIFY